MKGAGHGLLCPLVMPVPGGGGGGYSPNKVYGGVPLQWVTFSRKKSLNMGYGFAEKSLNMGCSFVILL